MPFGFKGGIVGSPLCGPDRHEIAWFPVMPGLHAKFGLIKGWAIRDSVILDVAAAWG